MLKILISNDDGVEAAGLEILFNYIKEIAEVFVIAPSENKSGAGSSISTRRGLLAKKNKKGFFYINGTPVDCVHLGLNGLCPFKPDLVLAGINYGANLAEDLVYSGTVAAAFEGRNLPLPCIAISAAAFNQPGTANSGKKPNFTSAALVTKNIIQNLVKLNLNSNITLNVNVPNLPYEDIEEISITTLGSWGKRNPPTKDISSKGEEIFWVTHRSKIPNNSRGSDISALTRGAVSITPIYPNFLSLEKTKDLSNWAIKYLKND